MLKINPNLIYNTGYILDDTSDPVYKIREMGDQILDDLYSDGEDDIEACKTGITLLECEIPLGVNIQDLYHDIYHVYKTMKGLRKTWTPKCNLQIILQSCMGYILHTTIPHLVYVYEYKFVVYMVKLMLEYRCSLSDIWDVIIRRALQYSDETPMDCTINALGWIDNETHWYLKRNTHVGLDEAIDSLGMIVPHNMRYDLYIERSYMGSMIYEKSPRWKQNYLKKEPSRMSIDPLNSDMKMKDTELLDKYGMLPRYSSRQELIELLRNIQYNKLYEIHDKEKYYGKETCINMDIIDSNTEDLYIIGSDISKLYTLDELIQSCENDMKFGNYPICKELAEDLLYFMKYHDEDDMCDIIIKYLRDSMDPIVSMRREVEKDILFKKFLTYIVEVGLYARRWRGHGKPYPYKTIDTDYTGNSLYETRMNSLNVKIMNIVNSTEFSWYRDNIVLHKAYGSMKKKFIPYYIAMIDGKECIRLMSEALIHTGCYYLHVIYGCKYQDNVGNILDINLLEFMNPISPEERLP